MGEGGVVAFAALLFFVLTSVGVLGFKTDEFHEAVSLRLIVDKSRVVEKSGVVDLEVNIDLCHVVGLRVVVYLIGGPLMPVVFPLFLS